MRYNSECLRCHGPDGMGSSYAPALVDSLKHMDYETFVATVAQGKQDLGAGQEKVMPTRSASIKTSCAISTTSMSI